MAEAAMTSAGGEKAGTGRRRVPLSLVFGAGLLAAILILALAGPALSPYDLDAMQLDVRLAPPSAVHWLGTDEFGRDVLSRVLNGAQTSLVMGFGATLVSLAFGVPLGLVAGYYRGFVDETIMRIVDIMISLPPIILGLLILSVTTPSLWKTVLAVGFVYIPIITRLTRSVTLEVAGEEYIQAAQARVESGWYILFHEILPNAWPPIIVETSLRITFAILLGSALSFLGLGPQPPASEWGLMIAESRPFIEEAPWIGLAPGLCLCLLLVAVNVVGEGLRDLLDPRLQGRGHG